MLVNQVVMGGISAGIGRFYAIAVEKQDLHGYLRDSRRLLGYATLAVVIIGLVLMAGLLWLGIASLAVVIGFSCSSMSVTVRNFFSVSQEVARSGGHGLIRKCGLISAVFSLGIFC